MIIKKNNIIGIIFAILYSKLFVYYNIFTNSQFIFGGHNEIFTKRSA